MNFKFSSNIVIPDFVALLKSFKKEEEEEETRVLKSELNKKKKEGGSISQD